MFKGAVSCYKITNNMIIITLIIMIMSIKILS